MALPRQLPTTHDFSTQIAGPFISSGGAAYVVARDDSSIGNLDVLKSANPSTTAFTVTDTADRPTSTGDSIIDVDAVQVGDVLHIAYISSTVPAMGDITWDWDYYTFNMATDQWVAPSDSTVWSTTADSEVPSAQIRIAVRGFDGDIVIVGKGPDAPDMGSPYDTLYHGYWNGSTWSTPTRIDTAVAGLHYRDPQLSNDYTTDGDYTVTWDEEGQSIDGRAVTGASHTHQSAATIVTGLAYNQNYMRANIVYNDGGTWRGTRADNHSSSNYIQAYRYDPTSNTPFTSDTIEGDITGADDPVDQMGLLCYDSATDTRYLLYVVAGTPDAIKYVSSVNEATWGDITSHSTPANDTQLIFGKAVVGSSPVDGGDVIAFLYFDNTAGTAYYDEIDLGGATTYQKTVLLSAAVQKLQSKTVSLSGAVQKQDNLKTVLLAAAVQAALTKTTDLDALLAAFGLTKDVELDAAISLLGSKTTDLDAVVSLIVQKTVDLDAAVVDVLTKLVALDAAVQKLQNLKTVDLDGRIVNVETLLVLLDAAVEAQDQQKTAELDAALQDTFTKNVDFDAQITATLQLLVELDAAVQALGLTKTTDLDAGVLATLTKTANLDAAVLKQDTQLTADLDAVLQAIYSKDVSLNAAVLALGLTKIVDLDAAVQAELSKTVLFDADIITGAGATYYKYVSLNAAVLANLSKTASLDAAVQRNSVLSVLLDAAVATTFTKDISLDAAVLSVLTKSISVDAAVQELGRTKTADFDAVVSLITQKTADLDAAILATLTKAVDFDALVSSAGITKTVDLDAAIQALFSDTVSLDAALQDTFTETLSLDAYIDVLARRLDLDAVIVNAYQEAVGVDAAILRNALIHVWFDAGIQLQGLTKTSSFDAAIEARLTKTASFNAAVEAVLSATVGLDASVQTPEGGNYKFVDLDAAVLDTLTATTSLDAAVGIIDTLAVSLNAAVQATLTVHAELDALLESQGLTTDTVDLDAAIIATAELVTDFDARLAYGRQVDFDAAVYGTLAKQLVLDALLNRGTTCFMDALLVTLEGTTEDGWHDRHRLKGTKEAGGDYDGTTDTEITFRRGLKPGE